MANHRDRDSGVFGPIQKTIAEANAWHTLTPALGEDLPLVRADVDQGRATLISWGEGEFYTVMRDATSAHGKELVIVAAAGKNSMVYLAQIYEMAKAQNYKSVRVHTMRPDVMLRMSKRWGFERAETIIKAVL